MAIRLLPRDLLFKTGPVDHADWNYRPILRSIIRQRYKLCLKLLPDTRPRKLLEIGYGSGVFLPELARRCETLHGIDIHPHVGEVQDRLASDGVEATLVQGSAEALPYEAATFDTIVALSCLEFVDDPNSAAREISRVLTPGGCAIVITPGRSALVDWGLRLLTGQSANRDYGDRRQQLIPALQDHLTIDAMRVFPSLLGRAVCLYQGLRLLPKTELLPPASRSDALFSRVGT